MVNGEHGHHGVPVLRPVVEALKIGPGSVTALRQTLKEQLALVWLLKNKAVQPRPAPLVSSIDLIKFIFHFTRAVVLKVE